MRYYIDKTPENMFAYEDDDTNILQGLIPFNAEMQENGLPYSDYLEADANGFHAKDDVKIQKKAISEAKSNINIAIQSHLDNEAKMLRYDDINSIGKYLGYDNEYRVECESLGVLASLTWKYVETQLIEVSLGNRELPTPDEAVQEAKDNIVFDYYVEE